MRVTIGIAVAALAGGGCDRTPAVLVDGAPADDPVDARVEAPACAAPALTLPGDTPDVWAIATAADGTTYLGLDGARRRIGRWAPGSAQADPGWLRLEGDPWVWALAVHPVSGRLLVATDAGLWEVDAATAPRATLLAPGAIRTVTVGPDHEIYFTSSAAGERVVRWTPAGVVPVTTTGFGEPSDLMFDDDGTLLVTALLSGLHRVTLGGDKVETGASLLLDVSPERIGALGRDDDGRYYLGFQLGDGVQRYDHDLGHREPILVAGAVRDLAFARGFLGCTTLHVALAADVRAVPVGVAGLP